MLGGPGSSADAYPSARNHARRPRTPSKSARVPFISVNARYVGGCGPRSTASTVSLRRRHRTCWSGGAASTSPQNQPAAFHMASDSRGGGAGCTSPVSAWAKDPVEAAGAASVAAASSRHSRQSMHSCPSSTTKERASRTCDPHPSHCTVTGAPGADCASPSAPLPSSLGTATQPKQHHCTSSTPACTNWPAPHSPHTPHRRLLWSWAHSTLAGCAAATPGHSRVAAASTMAARDATHEQSGTRRWHR